MHSHDYDEEDLPWARAVGARDAPQRRMRDATWAPRSLRKGGQRWGGG
ncbi:hypothetical protein [Methylocystis heyeri]|uniref:Uncharacterized protein n=1 Tax=Methylocystis heyeri TaxID=391905 RepID=A0A6B8K9Y7_9HYPH|nr:hypothetical protein [Methylocystis heyeri]QGM45104.1 hypothetical protein H2LOC_005035 [Methylocystis heyeri]